MIRKSIRTSIFTLTTILFCSQSYAVAEGFYTGMKFGPASNSGGEKFAQTATGTLTPVNPKSTQFGSRFFMGNKFNPNVGVEFGLNYFSKIKYDTKNVNTCNTPSANVRNFDATFKGDYPIRSFDVFGKAGVALIYLNESGSLNPDLTKSCGESLNSVKFKPTFSLGASYGLTQNWVVDASWDHLMVGGSVKSIDYYGIGFAYHFVDVYCGQFLC